jgi:hypothetical protein
MPVTATEVSCLEVSRGGRVLEVTPGRLSGRLLLQGKYVNGRLVTVSYMFQIS